MTDPAGQVITFYSYKGGTGRSMALANVGVLLGREEPKTTRPDGAHGVLLIDWDLEAPGLHRFFQGHLTRHLGRGVRTPDGFARALKSQHGLIDFFDAVVRLRDTVGGTDATAYRQVAFEEFAGKKYLMATDHPNLSLLTAGRLGDDYGERIGKFDWERFFQNDPGFFRAFREFLKQRFRYTLIDSRTGLTDTSGICTQHLPEKLAAVFVLNHQNIEGSLEVIRKVAAFRRSSVNPATLSVFPLPSRVAIDRSTPRQVWLEGGELDGEILPGYRHQFEALFRELHGLEPEECDLHSYFRRVQVPQDSDYAFGEKIAVLRDTADPLAPGHVFAQFAKRLSTLDAPWQLLPEEQTEVEKNRAEQRAIDAEQSVQKIRTWMAGLLKLLGAAAALMLLLVGLYRTPMVQRYAITRAASALASGQLIDDSAHRDWALAEIRADHASEADRSLDRITGVHERFEALLAAAVAWHTAGRNDLARTALERARKVMDNAPVASMGPFTSLGLAWSRIGDAGRARQALTEARRQVGLDGLALNPFSHFWLVSAWREIGAPAESEEEMARIVEGIQNAGRADFGARILALGWAELGSPEKAEALAASIPDSTRRAAARCGAAVAWFARGDIEQGNATVAQVLADTEPRAAATSRADAQALRALCLSEVGVAAKQAELVRQAATAARRTQAMLRDETLVHVAYAFVRTGAAGEAVSMAQSIEDAELQSTLLREAAKDYARRGDTEASSRVIAAIKGGSARVEAMVELAVATARAGDLSKAQEIVQQIPDTSRRLQAFAKMLSMLRSQGNERWTALDAANDQAAAREYMWENVRVVYDRSVPPIPATAFAPSR
jgi:hypothetical protein